LRHSLLFALTPSPPCFTLSPYTTLFRSRRLRHRQEFRSPVSPDLGLGEPALRVAGDRVRAETGREPSGHVSRLRRHHARAGKRRSEEHTSELQSRSDLVCRLLLEKKKKG